MSFIYWKVALLYWCHLS